MYRWWLPAGGEEEKVGTSTPKPLQQSALANYMASKPSSLDTPHPHRIMSLLKSLRSLGRLRLEYFRIIWHWKLIWPKRKQTVFVQLRHMLYVWGLLLVLVWNGANFKNFVKACSMHGHVCIFSPHHDHGHTHICFLYVLIHVVVTYIKKTCDYILS